MVNNINTMINSGIRHVILFSFLIAVFSGVLAGEESKSGSEYVRVILIDQDTQAIPKNPDAVLTGNAILIQKLQNGNPTDHIRQIYAVDEPGSLEIPVAEALPVAGRYRLQSIPYAITKLGYKGSVDLELDPNELPDEIRIPTTAVQRCDINILTKEDRKFRYRVKPYIGNNTNDRIPIAIYDIENGRSVTAYEGLSYIVEVRWVYPRTDWLKHEIITVPSGQNELDYTLDPSLPPLLKVVFQGGAKAVAQVAKHRVFLNPDGDDGRGGLSHILQRLDDDEPVWYFNSANIPEGGFRYRISFKGVNDYLSEEAQYITLSKDHFAQGQDHVITIPLQETHAVNLLPSVSDREVEVHIFTDEGERESIHRVHSGNAVAQLPDGAYDLLAISPGYNALRKSFTVSGDEVTLSLRLTSKEMQLFPKFEGRFEMETYYEIHGQIIRAQRLANNDLDQYGRRLIPGKDDNIYVVLHTSHYGSGLFRPSEIKSLIDSIGSHQFTISATASNHLRHLRDVPGLAGSQGILVDIVDDREPRIGLMTMLYSLDGDDPGILDEPTNLIPGRYRMRLSFTSQGEKTELFSDAWTVDEKQEDLHLDFTLK